MRMKGPIAELSGRNGGYNHSPMYPARVSVLLVSVIFVCDAEEPGAKQDLCHRLWDVGTASRAEIWKGREAVASERE